MHENELNAFFLFFNLTHNFVSNPVKYQSTLHYFLFRVTQLYKEADKL